MAGQTKITDSGCDYIISDDNGISINNKYSGTGIEYFTIYLSNPNNNGMDIVYKFNIDDNGHINISLCDSEINFEDQVLWFDGYTAYAAKPDENNDEGAIFVKVSGKILQRPKTDSDGNNLYRDSLGLITTRPSYSGTFYTHQSAIRKSMFNITDKLNWFYNVEPRTIVLVSKGNEERFAYYNKYTKTIEYSKKSFSIQNDPNLTDEILPSSLYSKITGLTGNGKYTESFEYREPIYLNSLQSYPEYDVYVDNTDVAHIEDEQLYAPDNPRKTSGNNTAEDVRLNVKYRKGKFMGDTIWINKYGKADTRIYVDTTKYDLTSTIYNINGQKPYILLPIYLNRDKILDSINQYMLFSIDKKRFYGKYIGNPNSIATVKLSIENGNDTKIIDIIPPDEIGLADGENLITFSDVDKPAPFEYYEKVPLGANIDISSKRYYIRDNDSYILVNETNLPIRYYYEDNGEYKLIVTGKEDINGHYYIATATQLGEHLSYYALVSQNSFSEITGDYLDPSANSIYYNDGDGYVELIPQGSTILDHNGDIFTNPIPKGNIDGFSVVDAFGETTPIQYYMEANFDSLYVGENVYYAKLEFDGPIETVNLGSYLCKIENVSKTIEETYYVTVANMVGPAIKDSRAGTGINKAKLSKSLAQSDKKLIPPSQTQYDILKPVDSIKSINSRTIRFDNLYTDISRIDSDGIGTKIGISLTINDINGTAIDANNNRIQEKRTIKYTLICDDRFRIVGPIDIPTPNSDDNIADYVSIQDDGNGTDTTVSITDYIADEYNPVSSFYIERKIIYTLDKADNANTITIPKMIPIDTLDGSMRGTIQALYRNAKRYFDDSGMVKLRGQLVNTSSRYDRRIRQISSSLKRLFEDDSSDSLDLSYDVLIDSIYNYSKGFLYFLINDGSMLSLSEKISLRPLIAQKDISYGFFIKECHKEEEAQEETPDYSGLTEEERAAEIKEDLRIKAKQQEWEMSMLPISSIGDRPLIGRLNEHEQYPLNEIYRKRKQEEARYMTEQFGTKSLASDSNIQFIRKNKPSLYNTGLSEFIPVDKNDYHIVDTSRVKQLSIEAIKAIFNDPDSKMIYSKKSGKNSLEIYLEKLKKNNLSIITDPIIREDRSDSISEKKGYFVGYEGFNSDLEELIGNLVSGDWEVLNAD